MTALAYLQTHGLEIELLPDGRLSVRPSERITTDIRSWVRLHKAELLAELAAQPSVDQHGPTKPCHCGCCSFYQAPGDADWHCRECKPVELGDGFTLMIVTE